MITIPELQSMLREFGGPLTGASLRQHPLAPTVAILQGMINLGGQLHAYEAEFDLLGINTAADVVAVITTLLDNIREAERQAGVKV